MFQKTPKRAKKILYDLCQQYMEKVNQDSHWDNHSTDNDFSNNRDSIAEENAVEYLDTAILQPEFDDKDFLIRIAKYCEIKSKLSQT